MKHFIKVFFILVVFFSSLFSQESPFNGKWILLKDKGSDFDYFSKFNTEFSIKGNEILVIKQLGPKRKYDEKLSLTLDAKYKKIEIKDPTFYTNLFMGLRLSAGSVKEVNAILQGDVLKINEKFDILTSQGSKNISVTHTYTLSEDKNILVYTLKRDTRKTGPEVKYILKKSDYNNAYVMKMTDDWDINTKLPEQACLISLQGIVNEEKPNLYFIYGEKWDFRFTPAIYDYLKEKRYFTFTELNSLEMALRIFKEKIKGYIVWDKKVRTSLLVSFTLAGLEKGIVITEEMIPLMQKYGLKQIEDFSGKFTGQSDYEIYSWAYDKYWDKCSKDYIVWLGGEHGTIMRPGVADFAIAKKAFCTDLSARKTDTLEFGLTNKLFSGMKPLSMVFGWHSYKKDMEEEFVTLSSKYAIRMEGLHTFPNYSFVHKVPPQPGYKYRNNHSIKTAEEYNPKKKSYITFVQSDGLGLGAWSKQGRGSIPYTWSLTPNWQWLAPVMAEYFFSRATPNDYFIGSPVPGYMYPKAIPKKYLPDLMNLANDLMKKLDINTIEFMDYSADGTEAGNNEMTKDIIDITYKAFPDAVGFINGYYPSFTYAAKGKRAFVSYEYYLSPGKSEPEVAADLQELAEINPLRPYFILVHVRQYSEITRVKAIFDMLGSEFEILPLDIFLKMAGENPTFKERFMKESEGLK